VIYEKSMQKRKTHTLKYTLLQGKHNKK